MDDDEQTIMTVVAGESGYRETDPTAPDMEAAIELCNELNAVIGVEPDQARALVAASMGADAHPTD